MKQWIYVAPLSRFPMDGGACAFHDGKQIAIFNYGHSEWYAVQNECPHQRQNVLSRGILGDSDGRPKVSCPLHKNSFYLNDGCHTGGNEEFRLQTYAVKVEGGLVYLEVEQTVDAPEPIAVPSA